MAENTTPPTSGTTAAAPASQTNPDGTASAPISRLDMLRHNCNMLWKMGVLATGVLLHSSIHTLNKADDPLSYRPGANPGAPALPEYVRKDLREQGNHERNMARGIFALSVAAMCLAKRKPGEEKLSIKKPGEALKRLTIGTKKPADYPGLRFENPMEDWQDFKSVLKTGKTVSKEMHMAAAKNKSKLKK